MARAGTKPTTQAGALSGNRTRDLLVYGMMLQPTKLHWPWPDVAFIVQSGVFSIVRCDGASGRGRGWPQSSQSLPG